VRHEDDERESSYDLAQPPPPFISPLFSAATAVGGSSSDILSLLPVVLRALRLEAARPSVDVRLWSRPGVFSAKLDDDFDIFLSGVAAAARIAAATARLYFFRGAVILDKRIPINDSAALRDFAATRVDVWVFDGGPVSPDVQPADDSVSESVAPTRSSGRSASQPAFRDAVLRRDGNSCVLCRTADVVGAKSRLEAAHVIAARSPQAICASVSLYNVYDSNNGITLCSDCHYWFDRYMWCVRPDGTVSVADALSMRPGCERWVGLCGCMLRVPAEPLPRASWPPPHYWGVQERLFEAAAAARHEIASGSIYSCEKCGARFENVQGLQRHRKCIMGRHIFTPIFVRAFPDAAATALTGEGRILCFSDTGDADSDASESVGE
jgi:hypothetical protein